MAANRRRGESKPCAEPYRKSRRRIVADARCDSGDRMVRSIGATSWRTTCVHRSIPTRRSPPSVLSLRLSVASLMASRAATDAIVHGSESEPANKLRSLATIVVAPCGAASAMSNEDSHTNTSAIRCLAISAGTCGSVGGHRFRWRGRRNRGTPAPAPRSAAAWRRGRASRQPCSKAFDDRLVPKEPACFEKTLCRASWLNTSKVWPPASAMASPPCRLQRRWPDWSVFLPCRRARYEGRAVERQLADSERAVLNDIGRRADLRARDQGPYRDVLRHDQR